MSDFNPETPIVGEMPSQDDLNLHENAAERIKNRISSLQKLLYGIITISMALIAATVLFDTLTESKKLKLVTILFFLFSILISGIGCIPYESKVISSSPESIESHKLRVIKYKSCFFYFALSALLIGMVIIIYNLIIQLLN